MMISFEFKNKDLLIEPWNDYPGISPPLVGDEVSIKVVQEEESGWRECMVIKRLFYPDGSVHIVVS